MSCDELHSRCCGLFCKRAGQLSQVGYLAVAILLQPNTPMPGFWGTGLSFSLSFLLLLFVHSVAHWNKNDSTKWHTPTRTHTFCAAHMCNVIKSFFYFSGWRPRRPLHHWRVPSWRAGSRPRWRLDTHAFSHSQKDPHTHTHTSTVTLTQTPTQPVYENKALHFLSFICALTRCNCTPVCSLSGRSKALRPKSGAWKSKCFQPIKQIRPQRQD